MRDRRTRLIAFIDRVGGNRPGVAVKIGFDTVTCAVLTDTALEDLAGRIRWHFWWRREQDRLNQAFSTRYLQAAE